MGEHNIPSPEEFYGFRMGTDRKLARWDKIIEYFWLLDKNSDRIKVIELGKSTEGNTFLVAIISSPENLDDMEKIKEISAKLADPRGLSELELEKLVNDGKSVVAFTNSLHATEVAACQGSSELAYDLITGETPEIKTIREETVLLLFPSFNPDGQLMVVDWYNEYLDTEYEGSSPPWLYQKYVGHDNARDGFQLTQIEGRMFVKTAFLEWHAQAYVDYHQMGGNGARFYIPPYADPINLNMDPVLWREHQLYGAAMDVKLQEEGKKGVESAVSYTGYWIPAFHLIGNFHNCASMITESASVKIATPTYTDYHQLRGASRGRPEYKAQTTFPDPWPGGWWHLRDLVEQQKISQMAVLEVASTMRRTILKSMVLKASRNIEKGISEPPYAYIIPNSQHDYLTAYKFMDILTFAGVEIHKSTKGFFIGDAVYPEGTHVIFLAQPLRSYIKTLLERTFYPDNYWTRNTDGSPRRPYDMATYTMAEFMGVKTIEVKDKICGKFIKIKKVEFPEVKVPSRAPNGYVLDCRFNDSYTAVLKLLEQKFKVSRFDEEIYVSGEALQPGAFLIHKKKGLTKALNELARCLHLNFISIREKCEGKSHDLKSPRIALYKRYLGGNMDEGWTRWTLEKFEIPYTSVMVEEILAGDLKKKYDVILFPSDHISNMTGEGREEIALKRGRPLRRFPPEYEKFLEEESIENLNIFVEEGGTIVALNEACEFVIEKFNLPVNNVVKDLSPKDFYCPGSTIKTIIDNCSSVAYGMPSEGLIINFNSPAFTITSNPHNEDYENVVRYPEERMLQSGWLIGEKHLSRKIALIDAKHGEGRFVLMGFKPQNRAQTHGTYKFLFNSLIDTERAQK